VWHAERLIAWHREEAGTIEGVHDVLKSQLTGGLMPSKYFGANAGVECGMTAAGGDRAQRADGIEADRVACGVVVCPAQPLRFLIVNTAGRIVEHARKTLLRLAALADRIALWREAMRLLPVTP
jgi:hypothetical protein